MVHPDLHHPRPSSTNLHHPPLEHPLPSHTHIHNLVHPGPERILPLHRRAVDHVPPPPFHHFRVLRPQAHPLARHLVLPQLGEQGAAYSSRTVTLRDRNSSGLRSTRLYFSS